MSERIASFLPNQFPDPALFCVEMAGITYPDPAYRIWRSCSQVWCIEYVYGGTGCIGVDGVAVHPEAGDVYILPYGHAHDYWSDRRAPLHKIWFNVHGRLCDSLMQAYRLQEVRLVHGCDVRAQFEEFLAVCERKDLSKADRALRCQLLFQTVLFRLSGMSGAVIPAQSPAVAAKEYLDAHVSERIGIGRLSSEVQLSASQLTRQFARQYGQTPYQYLMERKLETARLLLGNTRLGVKEIAFRLSFADEHYFSAVFRRRYGCPPGRWRARLRQTEKKEAADPAASL